MTLEEACRIVGCKPDDPARTKRAAWMAALKVCHPDANPNDPTAAERTKRLNAAWEIVKDPSKADPAGFGNGFAGARRPHDQPRQEKPKSEPKPASGGMTPHAHYFDIAIVNTIAGGGKTREWARREAKRFDGLTIIAAPTIALMNDIEKYLKEFNCVRPIVVINSDPKRKRPDKTVTQLVSQFMKIQNASSKFILILSHTIAAEPSAIMSFDQMAMCELTFDEIPEVAAFIHMDFQDTHWVVTRNMRAVPVRDGVVEILPADNDDSDDESAWSRLDYMTHPGRNDFYKTYVQPLVTAVLDPQQSVFVLEAEWHDLTQNASRDLLKEDGIDFLSITSPEKYSLFKSTTLMGARADHSLTYKLWQSVFKTAFHPHPIQRVLPTEHLNGEQITLWYAFDGRTSRSFLDNKKSTTDDTMFNSLALLIADFYDEFYPGETFVWSAPIANPSEGRRGIAKDFFKKLDLRAEEGGDREHLFDPDLRLPGNTRGLNDYREYDHAVLLSVINPNYAQQELLQRLGIPEEDIVDTFGLQILYQDLLRISIREAKVNRPQSGFVMDEHSARNVATMFRGINVRKLPAAYIPDPREPMKRGPKASGNAASGTERSRRSRANAKAARERAFKEAERDRRADANE